MKTKTTFALLQSRFHGVCFSSQIFIQIQNMKVHLTQHLAFPLRKWHVGMLDCTRHTSHKLCCTVLYRLQTVLYILHSAHSEMPDCTEHTFLKIVHSGSLLQTIAWLHTKIHCWYIARNKWKTHPMLFRDSPPHIATALNLKLHLRKPKTSHF